MRTSVLTSGQLRRRGTDDVLRVLLDAFDGDFGEHDWQHALGGHHVLVELDGAAVAHASVVPRRLRADGREWRAGYLEAVACAPAHQGRHIGSGMLAEANRLVRAHHQLGALSTGRWSFYERAGWQRWQGRTFVRDGGRLVRTPDDDDGLMVLRFGASGDLDLAGDISCEVRDGDDW